MQTHIKKIRIHEILLLTWRQFGSHRILPDLAIYPKIS